MAYIHLITGGERSGKSVYAEQLAKQLSPQPVYIATARIWDEEFHERVRKHQDRRGSEWINYEEEKYPSQLPISREVVLLDCLTLWATNFFFDNNSEVEPSLSLLKNEFDRLADMELHLLIVTNEIGLGGVSIAPIQRRFTELQGWLNQYIAQRANEVTLMVCGIPVKIK